MTKARTVERLTAERATAAERGLEAAKARQAETEATLRKSLADTEATLRGALETLETERSALVSERMALASERKAWSEADQEVLALWSWVMGMEEANTWLREQVAQQAKGLSALKNFRLGTYLLCFLSCWFLSLFLSMSPFL